MISAAELIRFGAWAQRLGRTPTPAEIRAEFPQLHRATVYRWRAWLLEAWGIEPTGAYLRTEAAPRG
jgi:hypothetical protein